MASAPLNIPGPKFDKCDRNTHCGEEILAHHSFGWHDRNTHRGEGYAGKIVEIFKLAHQCFGWQIAEHRALPKQIESAIVGLCSTIVSIAVV